MKAYLMALATLTIFSIPSLGEAATSRPGPYFSAFLGGSFARNATVSVFDGISSFSDEVSYDSGIYTGGTGGYDFGFMRLEGELSYRYADLDTVAWTNGDLISIDEGNIGVFATMFNVFFDLQNSSPVTPYLGGGIGFAGIYLSDTFGRGQFGYGQIYGESDDTVFAYQAGAGLDIALNNRYSLDIGYRYFGTDKADLDSYLGTNELKFESHNVLVGFKMKF
ncbi:MAG: porin family protein [Geobacteraceae bacterium]|nr:porin family protein [Geobacteraceae bacterium]